MKKKIFPIITLLLLAPLCGELLSSSAPPVEFFNPLTLLLFGALYGCGALLIRELVQRWNKGWASVFILGMAYGIFEEGVVVRSFFDPAWMDLGILGRYGRWMGVNWVWTVMLIVFHAAVSIIIPILLVELIFPSVRDETWFGDKGMWICGLVFLSTVLIAPLFGFHFTLPGIIACLLAIVLLGVVAYHWRDPHPEKMINKQPASSIKIGLISFVLILSFFFIYLVWPEFGLPVLITIIGLISLPLLAVQLIYRMGGLNWQDQHKWAAVFGALMPMVLLTFITEADNSNRPDDTTGMALVGLSFIIFLIVLGFSVKSRSNQQL
ncbi:MAG TPA: hypothetical protein G4N92_04565 [Anaerolineae bacterium]|nr:hypothetical protein [Anaerolineae bacterium]